MKEQWAAQWRQLVVVQQDLVCEYLRLVGSGASPDALDIVRLLLSHVSGTLENFRRHLPPPS